MPGGGNDLSSEGTREKLKRLLDGYGLPPQEANALAAIMLSPRQTAKEIGVAAEIAGNTVNTILNRLKEKGLIRALDGTPHRYVSIHPKAVFAMLDRPFVRQVALHDELETVLTQVFETRVESDQSASPQNSVETRDKPADAISWMFDRCKSARSSIWIAGGDLTILRDNPSLRSELVSRRDSCDLRVLTYRGQDDATESLFAELKGHNIPCKKTELISLPMVIVDASDVLMAFAHQREDPLKGETYRFVMAVSPALGRSLASLFEFAWQRGELI